MNKFQDFHKAYNIECQIKVKRVLTLEKILIDYTTSNFGSNYLGRTSSQPSHLKMQ